MRTSTLFLVSLLLMVLSDTVRAESPKPRFDGLYCHESDEFVQRTFDYLRFYPDGHVISTAATDRPGEVVTWFHRGHAGLSEGPYLQADGVFRFTLQTEGGWIACTGDFLGDDLVVTWRTHKGEHGKDRYRFIAHPLPPDEV
ncbi:MAG TPA: hypothetical protein VGW57_11810 [Chthoniobacterales bacterium]|nr:hypothetical protein [Chthoniobacterales bacterium]